MSSKASPAGLVTLSPLDAAILLLFGCVGVDDCEVSVLELLPEAE